MLLSLKIQNYAIIQDLEINLPDGLNIITGETGAGKSILLGALGLILGKRADSKTLFDQGRKCIVEGHFAVSSHKLKSFFKLYDLDYEDTCIIRREILASGKSRAFVNDSPVRLDILSLLGHKLVNIHSQHDTLDLNESAFQTRVLDVMAGSLSLLDSYQLKYAALKLEETALEQLKEEIRKALADRDYLQFQFDELIEIDLESLEQTALEEELHGLNHAEEIKTTLIQVAGQLDDEQFSALHQLRASVNSLQQIIAYNGEAETLMKRLESAQIELEDIKTEVDRLEGSTFFDAEKIASLNDKLDHLYRLQKKHGHNDVAGLIELRNTIDDKLLLVDENSAAIEQQESKVAELTAAAVDLANQLSKKRCKAAPKLEKGINSLLNEIGMPNARIQIQVDQLEAKPSPNGIDQIGFLFSANKGGSFRELKKVASGGELSRLMLVIKSLMASKVAMPTMVFDEIDTGVSGEAGKKVGQLMRELAQHHQLIAITHLPQIAGMGHQHYHVYKSTSGSRTVTSLKQLQEKDRAVEIAKMLSGEDPTEAALENAKELIA